MKETAMPAKHRLLAQVLGNIVAQIRGALPGTCITPWALLPGRPVSGLVTQGDEVLLELSLLVSLENKDGEVDWYECGLALLALNPRQLEELVAGKGRKLEQGERVVLHVEGQMVEVRIGRVQPEQLPVAETPDWLADKGRAWKLTLDIGLTLQTPIAKVQKVDVTLLVPEKTGSAPRTPVSDYDQMRSDRVIVHNDPEAEGP
jgi:hypothetical protein